MMTDLTDTVEHFRIELVRAVEVLQKSGTLAASQLGFIAQRIAGEDRLILAELPSAWEDPKAVKPVLADLAGQALIGDPLLAGAAKHFAPLFEEHAEISTFLHVHTPYLASWASAQRAFPILYVGAQRHTLAREIPVHIDRTTPEVSFILEQLRLDPHLPAILEGNGGASFWGTGLRKTVEFALLLEEAARIQYGAEQIGGSKDYGPGVLEQQWRRTGLIAANPSAKDAA